MGVYSIWRTWLGLVKFTSTQAKFLLVVPVRARRRALVDYWIGRFASFFAVMILYNYGSKYFVARPLVSGPPGAVVNPYTLFDLGWRPTAYFAPMLAVFLWVIWKLAVQGDWSEDARLLALPTGLPDRLPVVAHAQLFWRDIYVPPAERAAYRADVITSGTEIAEGDRGVTLLWVRPWRPVAYLSGPGVLRDLFMLQEFTDAHVSGAACARVPRYLWSVAYGYSFRRLQRLLVDDALLKPTHRSTVRASARLVTRLQQILKKPVAVDLAVLVSDAALDAVCAYVLGEDFRFGAAFRADVDDAVNRATAVFAAPPVTCVPAAVWRHLSFEGRRLWGSAGRVHAAIRGMVVQLVAKRLKRGGSDSTDPAVSLLEAAVRRAPAGAAGATDSRIRALSNDLAALLFQQYAVLRNATIWTVHDILSGPSGRATMIISSAREKGTQKLSLEELKSDVLGRCLRESMRMHPPAPALAPVTLLRSVELQGLRFRAGTELRPMPYALHRSGRYWGAGCEAKFDSQRFSDSENRQRAPFTYMPFGAGLLLAPCSERLRAQVHHLALEVVRNFDLKTSEEACDIDKRPVRGFPLPEHGIVVRGKLRR